MVDIVPYNGWHYSTVQSNKYHLLLCTVQRFYPSFRAFWAGSRATLVALQKNPLFVVVVACSWWSLMTGDVYLLLKPNTHAHPPLPPHIIYICAYIRWINTVSSIAFYLSDVWCMMIFVALFSSETVYTVNTFTRLSYRLTDLHLFYTLAHDDASAHCLATKCSLGQIYCPDKPFNDVWKRHCDLNLEHSKVIFE